LDGQGEYYLGGALENGEGGRQGRRRNRLVTPPPLPLTGRGQEEEEEEEV
jgi:hypothetical protein